MKEILIWLTCSEELDQWTQFCFHTGREVLNFRVYPFTETVSQIFRYNLM